MVKYTKYGKHRYKVLFFDEKQNHVKTIYENINDKNVVDKMDELGLSMLKGSLSESVEKKWNKSYLNRTGYYPVNKSGYLAVTESVDHGPIRTPNYRIIFIDMMQIDKLLKINLFKNEKKRILYK